VTPAAIGKLQAVADFVADERRKGTPAAEIISALQVLHKASYVLRPWTNTLRVAGVTGSCTWSNDDGLLDSWRRNAARRLAREREGA